jgi:hypothetical protein
MNKKMIEITSCEVCGNDKLVEVLDLGSHPLCDDLISIGDNRVCQEFPIKIGFCETCLTAHQLYQVPKSSLFTKDYHYRARMTGSVLAGMEDFVESCEARFGDLSGKKVLDIGCNDGSLLTYFKRKGCKTLGVEPTQAAADSTHETFNEFFESSTVDKILTQFGQPDIITFTNVFAHIEDLPGLLENLMRLMSSTSKLVIENHYLGAVFSSGQFDTFYHEHPRTYSKKSFDYIASTLGFQVSDVQFVSRYGGNIRVFIGSEPSSNVEVDENNFKDLFVEMESEMKLWIKETRSKVDGWVKKYGSLRAKAFPGRAAILIKLLGLDEKHISTVYEIEGSIKVGHYVPGTKIPIMPEADLYSMQDQTQPILNLAWHLPQEVRANLQKNGYSGDVLDLKELVSS